MSDPDVNADDRETVEQPAENRSNSRRDASLILFTNVISAAVSLVYGIAAARWFGADGRGQVVAFMYWPTLMMLIAMFGVPTASIYYSAHDRRRAPDIVGTGIVMMLVSGTVMSVALSLLTPIVLGDSTPSVITAGRVFAFSVLATTVMNATFHPFRVLGMMKTWNIFRLAVDAGPFIALLIVMGMSSRDFVTYAIALVSWYLATALIAVIVMARTIGLGFAVRWLKPLTFYGVPTVLAALPLTLNFRVDQAFLVGLVERYELGNYATAVSWSQSVQIITRVINFMVLPRVASLKGSERLAEQMKLLRLGVLLVILTVVPMTLVSPFVVPWLFGSDFAMAGRLSLIMVPAGGLLGLNFLSEELLRSDRILRGPLISEAMGLVFTLGSLFFVVPMFGVWGAAIVSFVVYLGVSFLLGRFLHVMGMPHSAPFLLPGRAQFKMLTTVVTTLRERLGRPAQP